MFLERVELKSLEHLKEEGCTVEIRKGGENNADLILIKTKDPDGRPVILAINGNNDKPWPTYVRTVDECFIMGEKTYAMFRHLFKDKQG